MQCIYTELFRSGENLTSIISNTSIPSCLGLIQEAKFCFRLFNASTDRNDTTKHQLLVLDDQFDIVRHVRIRLDCVQDQDQDQNACCNGVVERGNIGLYLDQPFIGLLASSNDAAKYLFDQLTSIVITILSKKWGCC